MTTQAIPRAPARLPHRMSPMQELEHQLDLSERALDRARALRAQLWRDQHARQLTLPLSGLRLIGSRDGSLLFRGGRDGDAA